MRTRELRAASSVPSETQAHCRDDGGLPGTVGTNDQVEVKPRPQLHVLVDQKVLQPHPATMPNARAQRRRICAQPVSSRTSAKIRFSFNKTQGVQEEMVKERCGSCIDVHVSRRGEGEKRGQRSTWVHMRCTTAGVQHDRACNQRGQIATMLRLVVRALHAYPSR